MVGLRRRDGLVSAPLSGRAGRQFHGMRRREYRRAPLDFLRARRRLHPPQHFPRWIPLLRRRRQDQPLGRPSAARFYKSRSGHVWLKLDQDRHGQGRAPRRHVQAQLPARAEPQLHAGSEACHFPLQHVRRHVRIRVEVAKAGNPEVHGLPTRRSKFIQPRPWNCGAGTWRYPGLGASSKLFQIE